MFIYNSFTPDKSSFRHFSWSVKFEFSNFHTPNFSTDNNLPRFQLPRRNKKFPEKHLKFQVNWQISKWLIFTQLFTTHLHLEPREKLSFGKFSYRNFHTFTLPTFHGIQKSLPTRLLCTPGSSFYPTYLRITLFARPQLLWKLV